MVLQFKVKEQRLSQLSAAYVVANSYNYVRAQFSFASSDWDEKGKTAVFYDNYGKQYDVPLDAQDSCRVPWECLTPPEFRVYIVGGSLDSEMIFTNTCSITVHPSSPYNYNTCCRPNNPDIYQQLVEIIERKQDKLIAGNNIDIDSTGKVSVSDEFVEGIDTRFAEIEVKQVSNIMFDEKNNEIWLVANEEQIGDKIHLNLSGDGLLIDKVEINTDGELVIFYTNGTNYNVGRVVGTDGKPYVYVPTIDDRKILTLTLSEYPGAESVSCDLNPNDEWNEVEDELMTSDYTWEQL